MDSNQLLNRMKERDMVAYHYLTERYGWKLYSYLKKRLPNQEQVDAAMNETLRQFYNTVAGSDDAIEALLISFADQTCQHMTKFQSERVPTVLKKRTGVKIGTVLYVIAVSFLLLCILGSIWVIIGILMSLGIIPEVDLGYSWFNANMFPWF